jgi:hypothetical protein
MPVTAQPLNEIIEGIARDLLGRQTETVIRKVGVFPSIADRNLTAQQARVYFVRSSRRADEINPVYRQATLTGSPFMRNVWVVEEKSVCK